MDEKQKIITKWLENEVKGKKWDAYFKTYGYRNLSVYGAGELGKLLVWALRGSEISVNCILDRRAAEIGTFETYDVYTPEEFFEKNIETDAVVVTVVAAYEEVLAAFAGRRLELPVMSLRDMVYEL